MEEKRNGHAYAQYDWAIECSFGITVLCLVFNIVLLCRIRYGDAIITKLTLKPYYVSLALLLTMCAEDLTFLITQNYIYKNDFERFFRDLQTNRWV